MANETRAFPTQCWCVVEFHAVLFGVAQWLGNEYRPPTVQHEGEVVTLNLVAAPVEPAPSASVVRVPVAATLPPVVPPAPVVEPPPPVERIIAETRVAVEPVRNSDPPEREALPETAPVEAKPNPETKVLSRVPSTTTAHGDGSSAQPGEDATTSVARPGVLARPNYLKNPEPTSPLPARRRQQQGVVLLAVKVSGRGRAVEISVKESSGHPILDEAALHAVRGWEFEPARIGSLPVESRIEVPVRFQLAR